MLPNLSIKDLAMVIVKPISTLNLLDFVLFIKKALCPLTMS